MEMFPFVLVSDSDALLSPCVSLSIFFPHLILSSSIVWGIRTTEAL